MRHIVLFGKIFHNFVEKSYATRLISVKSGNSLNAPYFVGEGGILRHFKG